MGDRSYSFDAGMVLSDGAAAITATGFSQKGGADAIIDLGGNQSTSPKQQARIDAYCIIQVSALDISSGDEAYKLQLLGSNDSNFGAAAVEMLGEIMLGKGSARDGVNMIDSLVGMYEIGFTNEQANVKYEFLKMRVICAGTTPSITFQSFVAVTPEP